MLLGGGGGGGGGERGGGGANVFPIELTQNKMRGKTENGQVASNGSVSFHLNPIALRAAKTHKC